MKMRTYCQRMSLAAKPTRSVMPGAWACVCVSNICAAAQGTAPHTRAVNARVKSSRAPCAAERRDGLARSGAEGIDIKCLSSESNAHELWSLWGALWRADARLLRSLSAPAARNRVSPVPAGEGRAQTTTVLVGVVSVGRALARSARPVTVTAFSVAHVCGLLRRLPRAAARGCA